MYRVNDSDDDDDYEPRSTVTLTETNPQVFEPDQVMVEEKPVEEVSKGRWIDVEFMERTERVCFIEANDEALKYPF